RPVKDHTFGEIPPHFLARNGFPEQNADGVDIRPAVEFLAHHLFGGHVPNLALEKTGLGAAVMALDLGDAKVEEPNFALERDVDVVRAHVAVNEMHGRFIEIAKLVAVVESPTRLADDVDVVA